jgi:hypothetical protein
LDGFDDLEIARAATEIARNGMANLGFGGMGILLQEGYSREQDARCAVTALYCTVLDKGLLQGMKLVAVSQTLDGQHAPAGGFERGIDAGVHWLTIHEDGAGTAFAFHTADFRAGKAESVA